MSIVPLVWTESPSSVDNKRPTTSIDEQATRNVLEILECGQVGSALAATKLRNSARPRLAYRFEFYSSQRGRLSAELKQLAAEHRVGIDDFGPSRGAMHGAWLVLRKLLSGDDPAEVLDAAEQADDHVIEVYEDVLREGISPHLRATLERQYGELKKAQDEVRSLRNVENLMLD